MQAITTIGLDIAKSVFQVHGVGADGHVVVRRQLKRRYVSWRSSRSWRHVWLASRPGRHPTIGHASALPIGSDMVRYFHGHYLRNEEEMADWRASPLRAPAFKGLPPAFVLTVGCDPLRDEGADYARLLEASDVPTTFVHMSDQMHGFLTMGRVVRAADTALELAAAALKRAFLAAAK